MQESYNTIQAIILVEPDNIIKAIHLSNVQRTWRLEKYMYKKISYLTSQNGDERIKYKKVTNANILLVKMVMFHGGGGVKDGQGRINLESQ